METSQLKNVIEAVLLSTDRPFKVPELDALFDGDIEAPTRDEIRRSLHELGEDYSTRGFELKEVASGFRLQVRQDYAPWVSRLWDDKPARYSRALLETIALIAYRQPVTRGEIEEVRGVSVSSNIIKTLLEREWIRVLGHKDVPGKPALYGTTKAFLDYFNLKSLDELPTLAGIRDLDQIHPELGFDETVEAGDGTSAEGEQPGAASEQDSEQAGRAAGEGAVQHTGEWDASGNQAAEVSAPIETGTAPGEAQQADQGADLHVPGRDQSAQSTISSDEQAVEDAPEPEQAIENSEESAVPAHSLSGA